MDSLECNKAPSRLVIRQCKQNSQAIYYLLLLQRRNVIATVDYWHILQPARNCQLDLVPLSLSIINATDTMNNALLDDNSMSSWTMATENGTSLLINDKLQVHETTDLLNTPFPPRKLKLGTVPDSGTVPLWLYDTFGASPSPGGRETPKTYRHSLSGQRREESPALTPTNDLGETVNQSPQSETLVEVNPVKKVYCSSSEHNVEPCIKILSSMRLVKSVKGRWPPKIRPKGWLQSVSDDVNSDGIDSLPLSQSRAFHVTPSVPTKEILEAFETGSIHQSSPSASLLRKGSLRQIIECERSILESINPVKNRIHELEPPSPRSSFHSASPAFALASACSDRSPSVPPLSEKAKPTTKPTYPQTELLRASYKIQYLGGKGREWEDGLVDPSFPAMVQRAPEDYRFDTNASGDMSLVIPGALRGPDNSDGRFDVSHGGNDDTPLCCYPRGHDHRFKPSDEQSAPPDFRMPYRSHLDTFLPSARPQDGPCSKIGCPPIPQRSTDGDDMDYIPTVWQTLVSYSMDGDQRKRKWRLKRVWEPAQDEMLVLNHDEPDYLVDEADLDKALHALLGVPEHVYCPSSERVHWHHNQTTSGSTASLSLSQGTFHTESHTTISTMSTSDLSSSDRRTQGRGRQWHEISSDSAPLMKDCCWRIQRVWDKDGIVVQVEAERSLNEASLLRCFGYDQSTPMSNGASDFSREGLEPHDESGEDHTDRDCDSESCSVVTDFSNSFDDGSFIEDGPLDDDEFFASLDSVDLDSRKRKSPRSLKMVRRKLGKVESMINDIRKDMGTKAAKNKLYRRLQEKCVEYLNELSEHLAEFEDDESQGLGPGLEDKVLDEIPLELSKASSDEVDDDDDIGISIHHSKDDDDGDFDQGSSQSSDSPCCHRDPVVVRRKLHKTEWLINRMVADSGDKARATKLYGRLHERRTGYLNELGLEYEPISLPSECQMHNDPSQDDAYDFTDLSFTSSLHSLLENMERLDVIQEEESNSCSDASVGCMEDERRDHAMLRRKKRKVEKEMRKIVAEKGTAAKTRSKLYKRYQAKLYQYCCELGESPETMEPSLSEKESSPTLTVFNAGISKLQDRVASAIGIVESTLLFDEGNTSNQVPEEEAQKNDPMSPSPLTIASPLSTRLNHHSPSAMHVPLSSPEKIKLSPLDFVSAGAWTSPLVSNDRNRKKASISGSNCSANPQMRIHSLCSVYL